LFFIHHFKTRYRTYTLIVVSANTPIVDRARSTKKDEYGIKMDRSEAVKVVLSATNSVCADAPALD